MVSTAKYFVPQLLAKFGKLYPELEIRLDAVAEPFAHNPHVVIASPNHPLVGQRRIRVDSIANETFIVREQGSGTRLAMQQFFDERQISCKVGMEMASNETIKQAVMAGMKEALVADRRGVQRVCHDARRRPASRTSRSHLNQPCFPTLKLLSV